MSTITGTVTGLDSTTPISGVYVTVRLVESPRINSPAFTAGGTAVGAYGQLTAADGAFEFVLTPNLDILPTVTCYRFDYKIPGAGHVAFYKLVGAIDADVQDLDDVDPDDPLLGLAPDIIDGGEEP